IGTAKTQIKLLSDAIVGYKTEVGKYPDSENGLRALLENVDDSEKWQGPYLNPAILPKDPWGNDYVYTCPGEDNRDFDIVSYGADGEPGGEGENADITSWEQ
ncbi:MAG: type II secretion system major pseudopilin GspG, partial [Lentisphaeria bacterium]|nr:type II secretion system major pseudopilin GspG [Lentisphaeria bacterium]